MSNLSITSYHERYKDYEYYLEQDETDVDCECHTYTTTSGVPLSRLTTVARISDYEGGYFAINWDPATNQFLVCKPGVQDLPIYRTEETLRALAQIIAFNPKEWGCSECGCSTEFKDYEYVCWCDTCKDGCTSPVQVEPLPPAEPRKKSPFFNKKRPSLPPPAIVPLVRLRAEPDTGVIMEDDERDEWFRNADDRANMMFRSKN
jgi:hypothetical protein